MFVLGALQTLHGQALSFSIGPWSCLSLYPNSGFWWLETGLKNSCHSGVLQCDSARLWKSGNCLLFLFLFKGINCECASISNQQEIKTCEHEFTQHAFPNLRLEHYAVWHPEEETGASAPANEALWPQPWAQQLSNKKSCWWQPGMQCLCYTSFFLGVTFNLWANPELFRNNNNTIRVCAIVFRILFSIFRIYLYTTHKTGLISFKQTLRWNDERSPIIPVTLRYVKAFGFSYNFSGS